MATASFVYTAWINAGRPPVPGSTADVEPASVALGVLLEAGPTPFRDALSIRFAGSGPLSVEVFDVRGARVERVVEGAASAGSATWQPAGTVAPGIYFVRLAGRGFEVVRRVARVR